MECPKCGHTNPDTAMNCEKCRINLEWAREHPDKRRSSDKRQRRKPFMAGVYVYFVVVGIVCLVSVTWGYVTNTKCVIVPCFLPWGIPLLPVGLWALLWPGSSYNVFRRSSTTARAKVLKCRIERRWSGGDAYSGPTTTYYYWVTVRFDAVRSGAAVEKVTLKAEVSEKLYDRLSSRKKVKVRYATEDPCIAFFEGEEVGLYSHKPQGKAKRNTEATASLILGVLSIVLAWATFLSDVGAVAAFLALVTGVRGIRAARQLDGQGHKLAIAGMASSVLGLFLFIGRFIPGFPGPQGGLVGDVLFLLVLAAVPIATIILCRAYSKWSQDVDIGPP